MTSSFKEFCSIFAFIFAVTGFCAFPAFWFFVDIKTAYWATPMLAAWQTSMLLIIVWGVDKIQTRGYTLRNVWWAWAATIVELGGLEGLNIDELTEWCDENTIGKWERLNALEYTFLRPSDAVAFKLRWYE